MNKRNLRHGFSSKGDKKSLEFLTYKTWEGMRQRCKNPKNPGFKNYGGRGITVCERWDNSFENFVADMGLKPSVEHSIERKDVNGNYEPGNCKWATEQEQRNNQRRSRRITISGQTKTASEWCRIASLPEWTLWNRLRMGWPEERLLEPLAHTRKNPPRFITIKGETKTASDWEKAVNLPHGVVRLRYAKGWAEHLLLAPLGYKRTEAERAIV